MVARVLVLASAQIKGLQMRPIKTDHNLRSIGRRNALVAFAGAVTAAVIITAFPHNALASSCGGDSYGNDCPDGTECVRHYSNGREYYRCERPRSGTSGTVR